MKQKDLSHINHVSVNVDCMKVYVINYKNGIMMNVSVIVRN